MDLPELPKEVYCRWEDCEGAVEEPWLEANTEMAEIASIGKKHRVGRYVLQETYNLITIVESKVQPDA